MAPNDWEDERIAEDLLDHFVSCRHRFNVLTRVQLPRLARHNVTCDDDHVDLAVGFEHFGFELLEEDFGAAERQVAAPGAIRAGSFVGTEVDFSIFVRMAATEIATFVRST